MRLPNDIGEWSNPDKCIDRLKKDAEASPGQVFHAVCGAWSLCFSVQTDGGKLGNVFSARVGRSTKERDWEILGRMAGRIGAPEEAMPSTIRTHATATHYWVWGGTFTREQVDAHLGAARALGPLGPLPDGGAS